MSQSSISPGVYSDSIVGGPGDRPNIVSQSSISPGVYSDAKNRHDKTFASFRCRNPVSRLEFILTIPQGQYRVNPMLFKGRNPVSRLEFILTEASIVFGKILLPTSQSSISPGVYSDLL